MKKYIVKRGMTLFLAIIMCIGMLPVSALAEGEESVTSAPVEPEHEHSWSSWTVTREASCTSAGSKQRACAECGAVEIQELNTLPHSFGEWTVLKAATCTEPGERMHVCTVCGAVKNEVIPAAHSFTDWVVTKPATCKEEGVKTRTCTVCGDTETKPIDKTKHSYGEWVITTPATCKEEGVKTCTCEVCGKTKTEKIEKAKHSYGEWVITKAATCTEEGEQTRTCEVCGKTKTEKIEKAKHSYGEWVITKAATCTEEGEQTRTCEVCGKTKTEKIEKAKHSYGEWVITKPATCKEEGEQTRTCEVCGKTKTEKIEKAKHSYGDWVITKAATCTEEGEQTRTCEVCGKTKTEKIEKAKHSYGEWVITKAATCKEKGEKVHSCTTCEKTEKEVIDKLEHNFGEWVVTTPPTCKEKGEQTCTCKVCGETETEELAKLDHSFGDWKTETEATCTQEGVKVRICEKCGEDESGVIPVIDHSFGEWKTEIEATCTEEGVKVRICEKCGEEENRTVPVIDHSFGEWKTEKEATCTEEGLEVRGCTECSEKEERAIPLADHVWGEDNICTVCGAEHEVKKPAQTLYATVGNLQITVDVPADRIPEGSRLIAASGGVSLGVAQAVLGENVKQVFSVILAYTDSENNIVDPGKVSVTVRVISQTSGCTYRAFKTAGGAVQLVGSELKNAIVEFSKSDASAFGIIELQKPKDAVAEEVTVPVENTEPAEGEGPGASMAGEISAGTAAGKKTEDGEPLDEEDPDMMPDDEVLELEELDGDDDSADDPEDADAEENDSEENEENPEVTEEGTGEETAPETVTVVFRYGEEELVSSEYTVGDVLGTLPDAPDPGSAYFFKGWFAGNSPVTANTEVTGAMTIDAVFDFMPASNGAYIRSTGKVTVSVSWGEGTFPFGTDPVVTDIGNAEAIAQGVLSKQNVTDALAFDLSFYLYGQEVQPANNRSVNVSVSFKRDTLEGDNFTILHETTSGGFEQVGGSASASGASFSGNHFSIYIVAATESAQKTFIFYKKGGADVLIEQAVHKNEKLNAVTPALEADEVFLGWILKGSDPETTPKTIEDLNAELAVAEFSKDETYKYEPVIKENEPETPITVNYVVINGDTPEIISARQYKDGDTAVAAEAPTAEASTAPEGEKFKQWTYGDGKTVGAGREFEVKAEDAEENVIIMTAEYELPITTIKFNGNGGTITGTAVYKDIEVDTAVDVPKAERDGYVLTGWNTKADGSGKSFDPDTTKVAADNLDLKDNPKDNTLYAQWGQKTIEIVVSGKEVYYTYDGKYHCAASDFNLVDIIVKNASAEETKLIKNYFQALYLNRYVNCKNIWLKENYGTGSWRPVGQYAMHLTPYQFVPLVVPGFSVTITVKQDGYMYITRAPLTVTAENVTKNTDDDDPSFTVKITGLIGNDTPDNIKYKISRVKGEEPGTYKITPKGDKYQGSYTVKYVSGTLTIKDSSAEPENTDTDPSITGSSTGSSAEPDSTDNDPSSTGTSTGSSSDTYNNGTDPSSTGTSTGSSSEPTEPANTEETTSTTTTPVIVDVIEPESVPEKTQDPENQPEWSLLNLILGVITTVVGAITGLSLLGGNGGVKSAEAANGAAASGNWTKLLGTIPAAASIITFFLTEDLGAKMVLADKWTIIMAMYCVVGGAVAYFTRSRKAG